MSYIELQISLNPFYPFNEILVASLSDHEFDSFVEEEPILKAYIEKSKFNKEVIAQLALDQYENLDFKVEVIEIEKENWNKQWEASFDPVVVGDFCSIRAPFHAPIPETKFEIIIEPKMSFGTGHHDTTQMMIAQMSRLDLQNKSVLDMGSGTGVLAILAEKMKASLIHAIDIEEWASENMMENFQKNDCQISQAFLGDVEQLKALNTPYDCILANINKNILLADIPFYVSHLKKGGSLILSGFFQYDNDELIASVHDHGLELDHALTTNDWSSLSFVKK